MKILCFGIAKDITGQDIIQLNESVPENVKDLRQWIESVYPPMSALKSYMVAVNQEYAANGMTIKVSDEIAIIPPVSGG